jgi:hypothetical protein
MVLYSCVLIVFSLHRELLKLILVNEPLPEVVPSQLPDNIKLMHQERNVAESIMSMCLDVTSFTKDNMNARKGLAALCDRPSLEAKLNAREKPSRPKATYCLKPTERKDVT